LGEKGKDLLHSAKDRLSQAAGKLRGSSEGGMDQAKQRVGQVGERLRETTGKAREQFTHGRDVANKTLEDYPLAIGGAALGIGMLIGLVFPRSRKEDELMGDKADELKQRAKERARDAGEQAIERGRHVV